MAFVLHESTFFFLNFFFLNFCLERTSKKFFENDGTPTRSRVRVETRTNTITHVEENGDDRHEEEDVDKYKEIRDDKHDDHGKHNKLFTNVS